MGIRESINQNPAITTGVTAGIIVLALAFIIWQAFGHSHLRNMGPGKAFFSDDDGKTWFTEDASKIPPIDHDGKKAWRVQVFKCGESGQPFVSHLEGFSDEIKAKMEKAQTADPSRPNAPMEYMNFENDMKVKKPGDAKWVSMTPKTMNEYSKIMTPVCPDGKSDNLLPLNPNE